MVNPNFQDNVALLVSVEEPGKTVRVDITLTEQELREIDPHARVEGMTCSAFLLKSRLKAS
jgi:hypothetical protein